MTIPDIWHTDSGQGTPVVLIHGYTVDHRVLLPLEAAFAERPGFRRIYLDLPGHGNSPRVAGATSANTVVEAVIDNIRRLVGDQRFAVVGQSFGGQIARAVTAAFGEQVLGMALLVPVVRWGADRTLPGVTTLSRDDDFLAGLPSDERELFALVMAHLDETRWKQFREYILPGWHVHDRAAAAELEAAFLLPESPESAVAPHRGRHLVVTTRRDALVGWRDQLALLDHYPRMTAAILDDAGHNPQIEAPRATAALVTEWLDALDDEESVGAGTGFEPAAT